MPSTTTTSSSTTTHTYTRAHARTHARTHATVGGACEVRCAARAEIQITWQHGASSVTIALLARHITSKSTLLSCVCSLLAQLCVLLARAYVCAVGLVVHWEGHRGHACACAEAMPVPVPLNPRFQQTCSLGGWWVSAGWSVVCAHCSVLRVCCWLSRVLLLAQSWVCAASCGCGWSVGVVGVVGMVLLPIFPCIPSHFPPSAFIAPTCPALVELLYPPAPIISAHPPTTHAHARTRTCVHTTHTTRTHACVLAHTAHTHNTHTTHTHTHNTHTHTTHTQHACACVLRARSHMHMHRNHVTSTKRHKNHWQHNSALI